MALSAPVVKSTRSSSEEAGGSVRQAGICPSFGGHQFRRSRLDGASRLGIVRRARGGRASLPRSAAGRPSGSTEAATQ